MTLLLTPVRLNMQWLIPHLLKTRHTDSVFPVCIQNINAPAVAFPWLHPPYAGQQYLWFPAMVPSNVCRQDIKLLPLGRAWGWKLKLTSILICSSCPCVHVCCFGVAICLLMMQKRGVFRWLNWDFFFCLSGRENACEKTSYMFLRKELPVRLANTMREVTLLPDNLLSQPSVKLVQKWWVTYLTPPHPTPRRQ